MSAPIICPCGEGEEPCDWPRCTPPDAPQMLWHAEPGNRQRGQIVEGMKGAVAALAKIGLPATIRPSFTLDGAGGGVAHSVAEFEFLVSRGLRLSPSCEILIEPAEQPDREPEGEMIE